MAKKEPTKLTLSSQIEVYASASDLKKSDMELLLKAQKAVEAAYAPYSHFYVGAAVLLENGKIIIGNNQENAAYPSSLCAERVAIYQAGAVYPNVPVKAIAVACKAKGLVINKPVTPCGSCRQAISEYENRFTKKIWLCDDVIGDEMKKVDIKNMKNTYQIMNTEETNYNTIYVKSLKDIFVLLVSFIFARPTTAASISIAIVR